MSYEARDKPDDAYEVRGLGRYYDMRCEEPMRSVRMVMPDPFPRPFLRTWWQAFWAWLKGGRP